MSPLYLATIFFLLLDNLTTLVFFPLSIVAAAVSAITAANAGSTATG